MATSNQTRLKTTSLVNKPQTVPEVDDDDDKESPTTSKDAKPLDWTTAEVDAGKYFISFFSFHYFSLSS